MGLREKYIEERFPRYFIFGESKDGTRVDVSDGNCDVVSNISRMDAEYLISERDKVVNMIHKLASAFDDVDTAAFKDLWYNDRMPGAAGT